MEPSSHVACEAHAPKKTRSIWKAESLIEFISVIRHHDRKNESNKFHMFFQFNSTSPFNDTCSPQHMFFKLFTLLHDSCLHNGRTAKNIFIHADSGKKKLKCFVRTKTTLKNASPQPMQQDALFFFVKNCSVVTHYYLAK